MGEVFNCAKYFKFIPDLHFVKAVHPFSQVADHLSLKWGTVVMLGTVSNDGSEIGELCIINTNSSIDHDNIFKNYSSIMPNAATGGNVKVGEFSVLGIGAGSVLLENTGEYLVLVG